MRLEDHLLALVAIWERATDRSRSRLATIVVSQGAFFTRIEKGGSFTVASFEKFLTYFRDPANWPGDTIPGDAADLLAALPGAGCEAVSAVGDDLGAVHAADIAA